MYSQTTRLLTILELLQTRPVWAGAELAARLEVDARTIRRYIMMLQDMGMPVEPVRGPGGGYRLRPGFKLPPLLFTEEEATVILISLLVTTAQQINWSAVPVEGALAKVLRVLPLHARNRLDALTSNLTLFAAEDTTKLDAALLLTLSDAVQQRTRVAMTYMADAERVTERMVEPYGLAAWWGNWYLVAYCCLRKDMRTIRLDRIRNMHLSDETFTRPDNFDCQAFLAEQMSRADSTHIVSIQFSAPLDIVRNRIPEHYGALSSITHGTLFETHYDNLEGLAHFLITLNLPFVVVQPQGLKTVLQGIARQLMASTGSSCAI